MAAPRSVGEFEIISAIDELVRGGSPKRGVRVGIGDDAAVLDTQSPTVVTTDALVEGVHFRRDWLAPAALGKRAFRVASSDIAAMGARPTYLLLSLMIPTDLPIAHIRRCAAGMIEEAARRKTALVGGNISSGPVLSLTLTVLGVAGSRVLRRDGAKPGDAVVVTGTLGAAAAGVELLTKGRRRGTLVDAYRSPPSRISLGTRLARGRDVTAMLDLSDGLGADLHHVCEASKVCARIDSSSLPISKALSTHVRRESGASILEYALAGEDYELLMTVGGGEAGLRRVQRACKTEGTIATSIGSIEASSTGVRVVDADGSPLAGGWDHMAGNR